MPLLSFARLQDVARRISEFLGLQSARVRVPAAHAPYLARLRRLGISYRLADLGDGRIQCTVPNRPVPGDLPVGLHLAHAGPNRAERRAAGERRRASLAVRLRRTIAAVVARETISSGYRFHGRWYAPDAA